MRTVLIALPIPVEINRPIYSPLEYSPTTATGLHVTKTFHLQRFQPEFHNSTRHPGSLSLFAVNIPWKGVKANYRMLKTR